jgi:hypothetical protein
MERSEAQKAADKRYAAKIKGKYKPFVVYFNQDEFAHVETVLKDRGMGKTEFLRWAVKQLENNK